MRNTTPNATARHGRPYAQPVAAPHSATGTLTTFRTTRCRVGSSREARGVSVPTVSRASYAHHRDGRPHTPRTGQPAHYPTAKRSACRRFSDTDARTGYPYRQPDTDRGAAVEWLRQEPRHTSKAEGRAANVAVFWYANAQCKPHDYCERRPLCVGVRKPTDEPRQA